MQDIISRKVLHDTNGKYRYDYLTFPKKTLAQLKWTNGDILYFMHGSEGNSIVQCYAVKPEMKEEIAISHKEFIQKLSAAGGKAGTLRIRSFPPRIAKKLQVKNRKELYLFPIIELHQQFLLISPIEQDIRDYYGNYFRKDESKKDNPKKQKMDTRKQTYINKAGLENQKKNLIQDLKEFKKPKEKKATLKQLEVVEKTLKKPKLVKNYHTRLILNKKKDIENRKKQKKQFLDAWHKA